MAKRAAIMVARYSHAHQFKRARRELKFLPAEPGYPQHPSEDRRRREAPGALRHLLALALRVASKTTAAGPQVYALHAPEVECIGRGKARAPYEFGCKVSIATRPPNPRAGNS